MHEYGVTESIVGIVSDKAKEVGAKKVTRISVVVGELSGFVPECIEFYFGFLAKSSVAEGARLDFEVDPICIRCRSCSSTFQPEDRAWICPHCQGEDVEITGGRGLFIRNMEVE